MSRYDLSVAGAVGSLNRIVTLAAFAVALWFTGSAGALAEEAEWIWAPGVEQDAVPQTSCYFRKSFDLEAAESAHLTIAADDQYELFVNGRRIGLGGSRDEPSSHDISRHMLRGRNVIAVKVTNTEGNTAGLAVRANFRLPDDKHGYLVTDKTWLTNTRPLPLWYLRLYGDRNWSEAQSFGTQAEPEPQLAERPPAESGPAARTVEPTVQSAIPTEAESEADRIAADHGDFTLNEGFAIELVMDRRHTGSLTAMTFNEFGQILCAREQGPLLMMADTNKDKIPDTARVWCDKVTNCHGILALNGDVYAVGEGPQGTALYRISDSDRSGTADTVATVLRFTGEMGEHGPHGLALGPDGLLYVVLGNYSAPVGGISANSPYRDSYEGDLVQPRLEDPSNHGFGVKAPGGVVVRTNIKGDFVEVVAGGLRNSYDLAFNSRGDLFTADNDMQRDIGLPWHRPPRLHLVTEGAEFGWRSGWAKWPAYFVDSLPDIGTTGNGAPTGMIFYDHFMFPKRYHGALFTADWQQGRILAITLQSHGAGYKTESEVFAEGKPMNVTDLAVGPDGWLYFVTGGRSTPGGLYRIVWEGKVPKTITDLGTGIAVAIRQPQLQSAWSRQKVATQMVQLGDRWGAQLAGVASTDENPLAYRLRALDLMQLFGPSPEPDLLVQLSRERNPQLRAKSATLMGIQPNEITRKRLVELLDDDDPLVRRKACESLIQAKAPVLAGKLDEMLISSDRFEAWAARRMLEKIDPARWEDVVLQSNDQRIFIQGATALLVAKPDKETAKKVTDRISKLLREYVSDPDFIDLLRVTQLAILRGKLTAEDVPLLRTQLADEFPSGDATMNRELIRLLVYLNVTSIADRYVAQLESDLPQAERLHLGLYVGRLNTGWTTQQKFKILKFYEEAFGWEGGRSYRSYVERAAHEFTACLSTEEKQLLFAQGEKLPVAAFAVMSQMPEKLDAASVEAIKQLDKKLALVEAGGETTRRLKIAVVAVLARSGDAASVDYLREIFDRDPDRRNVVALGLAQLSGDANWDYLVRSLPSVEGVAAIAVVDKLAQSERVPNKPEPFRDLIHLGLTLEGDGGTKVDQLLQKWSGETVAEQGQASDKSLDGWQQWFARQYPDYPSLKPGVTDDDKPAAAVTRKPDETTNQ